jgi:hypothetical protein
MYDTRLNEAWRKSIHEMAKRAVARIAAGRGAKSGPEPLCGAMKIRSRPS